MSDMSERCMRGLKTHLKTDTGRTLTDDEVIALLRGDAPLDEPVARVIARSSFAVLQEVGMSAGVALSAMHATYTTALLMDGAVTRAELADHPEVMRYKVGSVWPPDKPFPLTPLEAWYVMRGWCVAPAAGVTMEQILDELPGKLEGGDGWVALRE